MSPFLNQEDFLTILDHTPLVSIDLIVRNPEGKVLLGKRDNRPAQGYWFVPGGRIQKNETLKSAFERLCSCELGCELAYQNSHLLGAYDHLYTDNFASGLRPSDGQMITTHYVALGHEIRLREGQRVNLDDQHSEHQWWDIDALLASDEVHDNTKAYFK